MSDLPETPTVPGLETFPVTGEPGAVIVQGGSLSSSSHLLANQAQQINGIAASLAPNWSGEAADGYQSVSGLVAGAFERAAAEIATAASALVRYAGELEHLQSEARAAAAQSAHWHQQIVTWTAKLNQAKAAVNRARSALSAAQSAYATARALGPHGAGAASAASAAASRAQAALKTAEADVTRAQRQLAHAHQEFTNWQERAKRIQAEAQKAGEELAVALLLVTVVTPPILGGPDYPALEPTPGITLNDDDGQQPGGEGGGQGDEGESGGQGEGGENGAQGEEGKKEPEPPIFRYRTGPDGKPEIVPPERPDPKPVIGVPPKPPPPPPQKPLWVLGLELLSKFFPPPH